MIKTDDPRVEPAIGRSIEQRTASGVTTHYGATASCTESVTVGKPYKSNGYAWARISMQRSSGCSASKSVGSSLETRNWLGFWSQQDTHYTSVPAGYTVSWNLRKKCGTAGNTTWAATGAMNGDATVSPHVVLSCGF